MLVGTGLDLLVAGMLFLADNSCIAEYKVANRTAEA